MAPDVAEVSFAVEEDAHGLGLGSLLLEHLAAEGRRRGIARFVAHVMAGNREMLDVVAHAGFAESHHHEQGTVELTLATDLALRALDAADAKERAAQTESLRPLLQPRSIAVVGVRADGSGVGAAFVRSIVEGGFGGALAVVHPSLEGVEGIGVWPRFSDIPGQVVDLAVAAATALGYPVAVKASSGDVVRKTERGLVRLGLSDAAEVRTAVAQIEELLAPGNISVVVQPMTTGVDIALGVVRDDRFGPLVMAAAGGIHTDVWQDRCFLIPPISRDAAARAVRGLRIFPLLAGHRGTVPADVDALIDMVVRVGLLAEEIPELAELDVNPVYVDDSGCRIVDVKLRLAPAPALDAGVPRRLRDRP